MWRTNGRQEVKFLLRTRSGGEAPMFVPRVMASAAHLFRCSSLPELHAQDFGGGESQALRAACCRCLSSFLFFCMSSRRFFLMPIVWGFVQERT